MTPFRWCMLRDMTRTYPRLLPHLPVLDRGDGTFQIGIHDGVVLTGDPALRKAAMLLDGRHSTTRIATLAGLPRRGVVELTQRLTAAGLLVEASEPTAPASVRLLGSGALARAFAEEYAAVPPADLVVVDPAPPGAGLYAHSRPTGAESLKAHLQSRGFDRVRCSSHWYRPEEPVTALTVIAYDRLECDRAITDTLVRSDHPHLLIRPQPDGIVVGPLVVPGRTCCTRCMDLVRARDSAWPTLLLQLCRTEWRPPNELVRWAAATAVLQVRAWLNDSLPETWGSTLEVRTGTWRIEQRVWPHHPDCGCGDLRLAI